jgi:hypothetical protein
MPYCVATLLAVLAFCGWRYWKHKASERWPKVAAIYEDGALEVRTNSLRGGPLYVRYRPSKPKVYVCDPFRDVRP